jgi:hypothetical protein
MILSHLGFGTSLVALFCVLNGWMTFGYGLLALLLLALLGGVVAAARMAKLVSQVMGSEATEELHFKTEVGRNGLVRFVQN